MAEDFDKDFGYLIPFIDRIAAAALQIADSSARDEATRLVADEKARWTRLRALLSGAAGKSPVEAAGESPSSDEPRKETFQFTVGSLRKRPGAEAK